MKRKFSTTKRKAPPWKINSIVFASAVISSMVGIWLFPCALDAISSSTITKGVLLTGLCLVMVGLVLFIYVVLFADVRGHIRNREWLKSVAISLLKAVGYILAGAFLISILLGFVAVMIQRIFASLLTLPQMKSMVDLVTAIVWIFIAPVPAHIFFSFGIVPGTSLKDCFEELSEYYRLFLILTVLIVIASAGLYFIFETIRNIVIRTMLEILISSAIGGVTFGYILRKYTGGVK